MTDQRWIFRDVAGKMIVSVIVYKGFETNGATHIMWMRLRDFLDIKEGCPAIPRISLLAHQGVCSIWYLECSNSLKDLRNRKNSLELLGFVLLEIF